FVARGLEVGNLFRDRRIGYAQKARDLRPVALGKREKALHIGHFQLIERRWLPRRIELDAKEARLELRLKRPLNDDEIGANLVGVSQNDRALDEVPELADVAWVTIPFEELLGFGREKGMPPVKLRRQLREKAAREWQDVRATLPQRWQPDGENVEPVEEVEPE